MTPDAPSPLMIQQTDATIARLERRIPEIRAEMHSAVHRDLASLQSELANAEQNLAGWRAYRQHLAPA